MHKWGEKTVAGQLLDILLRYHPDLNIKSKYGDTALDYACLGDNCDTALVSKLVSLGAKLESNGRSALLWAAKMSNAPMVEHLLNIGANPNFKDNNGNTALLISYDCCGDGFGEGISEEMRIKTAEILFEFGADGYLKNNEGVSFIDKCLEEESGRDKLLEWMKRSGLIKE